MAEKKQVFVDGQWRNCAIIRPSSYQGRHPPPGGWHDFVYDPLPVVDPVTGIRPSFGGTSYLFRDR